MKHLITKIIRMNMVPLIGTIILYNCSGEVSSKKDDPLQDKGIGPITSVTVGPVDTTMALEGKKIYDSKCTACHNPTQKLIGPPQKGILERRTPEWVMNLLLNTQEMLDKNPAAKKLLQEYNNVPMTNQGLTQDEARKILEYLRIL